MPAKSKAQQKFMGMCSTAEGRKQAMGKCPPKEVAKEFAKNPKGKKLPEHKKKKRLSEMVYS